MGSIYLGVYAPRDLLTPSYVNNPMNAHAQIMTKLPDPLDGTEQVLHHGRWVDVLSMPNFDVDKKYAWRNRPDRNETEIERLKRGQATCLRALETAIDESITLRAEIKRLENGLRLAIAWANNDADHAPTSTSRNSLKGRARDLSSLLSSSSH